MSLRQDLQPAGSRKNDSLKDPGTARKRDALTYLQIGRAGDLRWDTRFNLFSRRRIPSISGDDSLAAL